MSETTYDTNGVPGTTSLHESFGGMQVQAFGSSSYAYNSEPVSTYDTAPSSDHIGFIYYASFDGWHT
jgi:hypothetical protein